jgi:hypothetical protein
VVYSAILGEVAADLERATVPVIDDLSALAVPPDVIHGHHHLDAMAALIFTNYASASNYVYAIRAACQAASIDRVDVVGL